MEKNFYNKLAHNNILFTRVCIFILTVFILFVPFDILTYALDDNTEEAVLRKASIYIAHYNYSKAVSLLLNSLDKFPDSKKIPEFLGKIFFDKEIYDLALKYFLLSYDRGNKKNYELCNYIGESYAYLNKNKKAVEWFNNSLEINPFQPFTIYNISWIYIKEKKYEKAKIILSEAIDKFRFYPYLYGGLAVLYTDLHKYNLARKYYDKALKLANYKSAVLYFNKAIIEYRTANYKEAEKLFNLAKNIGNLSDAYYSLGEIETLKMNYSKALKYFKIALHKIKTPYIYFNFFDVYKNIGDVKHLQRTFYNLKNFQNISWLYIYDLNLTQFLIDLSILSVDYYQLMEAFEKQKFYLKFSFKHLLNLLSIKSKIIYYSFKVKVLTLKELKHHTKIPVEYYKNLMNITSSNRFLYFYFLKKYSFEILRTSKKLYASIWFKYLKYYGQKTKNVKLFRKYEDLFLKSYDKIYEKELYFEYLIIATKFYQKLKKYDFANIYLKKILILNPSRLIFSDLYIPVKLTLKINNLNKYKLIKKYFIKKRFIENKFYLVNISISQISNSKFQIKIFSNFINKSVILTEKQIKDNTFNIYNYLFKITNKY